MDFGREYMGVDQHSPDPFYLRFLDGCTCGLVAGCVSNPAEIIKARVQSGRYNYSGPIDGTLSIIREEGGAALFTGVQTSMVRVCIGTSSNLVSFSYMKDYLQNSTWYRTTSMQSSRRDLAVDCVSGLFSGTFLSFCMNPVDNIRTRLYNQPKGPDGAGTLYSGMRDALVKTVRQEGLGALTKGLMGNISRQGPHMVLVFSFKGLLERQYGIYSRPREIRALFKELDTDGDNYITREEARAWILKNKFVSPLHLDKQLLDLGFNQFDTDGDDYISIEEFKQGLEGVDYVASQNLFAVWQCGGVGAC